MSKSAHSQQFLALSSLKPLGSKPIADKLSAIGGISAVGQPLGRAQMFEDGVSYLQEFAGAVIFYSPAYGAVSIDRTIYNKWKSPSLTGASTVSGVPARDYLGFPISDAFATIEPGGTAAYFERGLIITRVNQRAYVVCGPIYEHYRRLGDIGDLNGVPVVGLPISDEEPTPNGGRRSRFDTGDIYWTAATEAREVHGAIRDRWLAMGGPLSVLGYPTSDECPVMNGKLEIGRFNSFANGGFIYWSPATGAWDVYGAIFSEWNSKGGPLGPLGFPTSGETSTPFIPGFVAGRFNDFTAGVIVWYPEGDYAGAHTVQGALLYLESYDCDASFNVQINIEAIPATPPNINHGRMPSGGNYGGGGNELDTPLLTVPLIQSDTQVNIWMLCIHENTFGSDDELGTVTTSYNILNLWGLVGVQDHAHQNGAFTATFEMQPYPLPPVSLDPDQFRSQLFWPFRNFKTQTLDWPTYSETFSDVAATDKHVNFNPFDFKMHLFEIAFYSIVYESIAANANCFGLALESIFAREQRSLFIEPVFSQNAYHKDGLLLATDGQQLVESTTQTASKEDAEMVSQANIKQGYQVGVTFMEWFLGKWVTGGLHQPIDAFYDSKQYFDSNDWPILSVSKGGDLSGNAHALVPYKWSPPQAGELAMWVANVNYPPAFAGNDAPYNVVTIDSVDDSFEFQMHNGIEELWFGSPTTGGMLLAIPYSKLNTQPVTPGDAIVALIVAGVVIICGGDVDSTQITDERGRKFYSRASRGDIVEEAPLRSSGASVTRPASLRRINLDIATRPQDMARIPLHGATSLETVVPRNLAVGDAGDSTPIVEQEARSPEIYYLHRSTPFMRMQPKTIESSLVERLAGSAAGTRSAATTGRQVREEMISPETEQELWPSALTFEMTAQADGAYRWAILSPRMSASLGVQCVQGFVDTIQVDSVNDSGQVVTFAVPPNSPSKTVSMAVGGFSGGDPAERRWYELINMTLAAGQTLAAQVNNRGGELLLRNTGPAVAFELRVHYGMDPSSVAVRPQVSLDADKAFHIAPQEWNVHTIKTTQVHMTVFDALSGSQVGQLKL